MADAHEHREDMGAWCAGFPLESRRPLTPDERADLQREARRGLWLGWGCLATFPLMWIVLGSIIVLPSGPSDQPWDIIAPLIAFAAVIWMMLSLLWGRGFLALRKQAMMDLRAGEVYRFSGIAAPGEEVHPVREYLIKRRLMQVGEPQALDVLSESGRVWAINGRRARKPLVLPIEAVAETPDFAAVAAEWVQPVAPDQAQAPYLNDREMTESERAELSGVIRGMLWRNIPVLLLLNAWVLGVVLPQFFATDASTRGSLPILLVLIGVTLWRNYLWVRRFRTAKALSSDLRFGRVLIARMPLPVEATEAAEEAESPAPALSAAEEFLPHSQALWTVDGHPAPWRHGTHMRPARKPA